MLYLIGIYLITVAIYLYGVHCIYAEDRARGKMPDWEWTMWTRSFVFIPVFNTVVLMIGLIVFTIFWIAAPKR